MAEESGKKAPKDKSSDAAKAKKSKGKGAGKRGAGKKSGAPLVKIAEAGATRISPSQKPRLQEKYEKTIAPALQSKLGVKNKMQIPRLNKIVINCAIKDAVGNPKLLDTASEEIMAITGQKPIFTRARKAISNFKLRAGIPLGVRVTLRRARMYEFLDRLTNIALPRVRDFRGVSTKGFDGRGNYSLGLKEQIIFPEINFDRVDKIKGMTVTIQTSATTNDHARTLLAELGMPFRK